LMGLCGVLITWCLVAQEAMKAGSSFW